MAEKLSSPVSSQGEQQTQDTQDKVTLILTDDEVAQLEQYKVEKGSAVWMMLGVTGTGKSCVGNFILGEHNLFSESSEMISETAKAALRSSSFDSKNLCVIDTPGLGDTENIGKSKTHAEDAAIDYSTLASELTKVMMMTDQGINAFLIVVSASHRDFRGLDSLLAFFDIIGDYWNHSILVVTHGKKLGKTEEEQYTRYREMLAHPKCSTPLKSLMTKVSGRLVIAEAKKWRDRPEYHRSVVGKIMKYSKEITERHGPFQDDVHAIGTVAREKAKLELRNDFENFESSEAQKAIYQSIFKHVKEVIHKLVRIKLADGEDVDKLKKMAKLKEGELKDVRNLTDLFRNEYQEEKKKRREAEESLKQAEIRQMQAEERKTQAEGERDSAVVLRQEADRNRVAAEQQKERAEEGRRAAEQQRERLDEDRRAAEQQKESAEKKMAKYQGDKQAAESKIQLAEQKLQIVERDKSLSDQERKSAVRDMEEAKNQKRRAETNMTAAVEQRGRAERGIEEAINQKVKAEKDRTAAIEQQRKAEADRTKANKELEEAEKGKRVAEQNMRRAEEDMNQSKTQMNIATALFIDANLLRQSAEDGKEKTELQLTTEKAAREKAEADLEYFKRRLRQEASKNLFQRIFNRAQYPA